MNSSDSATAYALSEVAALRSKNVLVVAYLPPAIEPEQTLAALFELVQAAAVHRIVSPRPYAVGHVAETLARIPGLELILPMTDLGSEQLADLEESINRTPAEVVVLAIPNEQVHQLHLNKPFVMASDAESSWLMADGKSPFAGPLAPDLLESLTRRLVGIPSVTLRQDETGEYGENRLARELESLALAAGLPYESIPLADGRRSIAIHLPGQTRETIVLSGHVDTVGVSDYGSLDAFDPDALAGAMQDPRYLYGRGSLDMKSGIAIGLQLMVALKDVERTKGVIFLAVPDEENASAGILAAGEYLARLKQTAGLKFVLNITLDYTTDEGDDPDARPLYGGVIGKLLPNFFIVGRDTHVSEPFNGISSVWIGAEITRRLEANPEYGDQTPDGERRTPPPALLRSRELKEHYNVQTPHETHLYVNYLTYHKTPATVLRELTVVAREALSEVLTAYSKRYQAWQNDTAATPPAAREGIVLSYAELLERACKTDPDVLGALNLLEQKLAGGDPRDISLAKVQHLCRHVSITTPFVVCYFSAPYYPSAALSHDLTKSLLESCVTRESAELGVHFEYRDYYPYISDMSFLTMQPAVFAAYPEFARNAPYMSANEQFDPEVIRSISMPVANIGPFGYDAHKRTERVDIAFTFGQLPKFLWTLLGDLGVRS